MVLSKASRTGKRLFSDHFTAIIPSDGTGYAVVVSKKIARLSVTRHRIKRQVFEALKILNPPKSIILVPKASVIQLNYTQIKADLSELLSKIH